MVAKLKQRLPKIKKNIVIWVLDATRVMKKVLTDILTKEMHVGLYIKERIVCIGSDCLEQSINNKNNLLTFFLISWKFKNYFKSEMVVYIQIYPVCMPSDLNFKGPQKHVRWTMPPPSSSSRASWLGVSSLVAHTRVCRAHWTQRLCSLMRERVPWVGFFGALLSVRCPGLLLLEEEEETPCSKGGEYHSLLVFMSNSGGTIGTFPSNVSCLSAHQGSRLVFIVHYQQLLEIISSVAVALRSVPQGSLQFLHTILQLQ